MARDATAKANLFALRKIIARLENRLMPSVVAAEDKDICREKDIESRRLGLNIPAFDDALQKGFPLDAITEFRTVNYWGAGASSGFVLALAAWLRQWVLNQGEDFYPILWVSDPMGAMEAGLPYALGFQDFGFPFDYLVHAVPRKLEDALWIAEAAISSRAFSLIVFEVQGNPKDFGLTESRRLSLRAKASNRPLFLLRQSGQEEASSALFRFLVEPALSQGRVLPDGSIFDSGLGAPRFRLTLEKSRNPSPFSFLVEWNAHERQFSLVDTSAQSHQIRRSKDLDPVFSAPFHGSDRAQEMGAVMAFKRKA